MKKANSITGAVYCPSALYDGWVTEINQIEDG